MYQSIAVLFKILFLVLFLGAFVGCGGGSGDSGAGGNGGGSTPGDDSNDDGSGNTGGLSFTDIQCSPAVDEGKNLVPGKTLACSFVVDGPEGDTMALSCERLDGSSFNCGEGSTNTYTRPHGQNALPMTHGLLSHPTNAGASGTDGLVLIATSAAGTARHRIEYEYGPDDAENHPPTVMMSCSPTVTSDDVTVTAGERLECAMVFGDDDPDTLEWEYVEESGATSVNNARPFSSIGMAALQTDWSWQTDASESGTAWKYVFTVEDGVNAPVTRTLTVNVD